VIVIVIVVTMVVDTALEEIICRLDHRVSKVVIDKIGRLFWRDLQATEDEEVTEEAIGVTEKHIVARQAIEEEEREDIEHGVNASLQNHVQFSVGEGNQIVSFCL
jgi:hypothetical protein